MNVHCLITIRNKEVEASSTLVLQTIRKGFPTAHITLWLNHGADVKAELIPSAPVSYMVGSNYTHPEWIEMLIEKEQEPFFIVDGDVICHSSVEDVKIQSGVALAGRFEPTFYEPWTKTIKIKRLHTCLLYLDPVKIRFELDMWKSKYECCVIQTSSLIKQEIVPFIGSQTPVFYDTCAKLYHSMGGQAFSEEQNKAFSHLNCGTYSDIVKDSNYDTLMDIHRHVCNDITLAETLNGKQTQWYKKQSKAVFYAKYADLYNRVAEILAHNLEAKNFALAYGEYIEVIDDMVDETVTPKMVDDSTFMASKLFSSNYWTANRNYFLVVEQLIHIIYFNTVKWERSNEMWKRRDAKALSHCGYYMLFAVLLLETQDSALVQEIALEFQEKAALEHLEDLPKEVLNA